jgi:quercetin dioxygenase-like cupin family protein
MRTRSPGERALLRGDEDNYGQSTVVHLTARPPAAVVGEHLHPQRTERFWVISGRLGTPIVGGERTLVAGQDWSGQPSVSQARSPRCPGSR